MDNNNLKVNAFTILYPYDANTSGQLVKNLVSTQYFLYTTVNNLEHIFSFESRVEMFRVSDTLYAEGNTTEGKSLSFWPVSASLPHKFLRAITHYNGYPTIMVIYICMCVCVCVCVCELVC